MKKISIHLKSQSHPIEYIDVLNCYTKENMYCVCRNDQTVHKYPLVNIFRVIEDYK